MSTTARGLAENILRWSAERIDGLTLALRLAEIDRATVKQAYKILEHELVPQIVASEVDEFYRRHGRYMTDAERDTISTRPAPSGRILNEVDRTRLEQLVKEVTEAVCAAHPRAGRAESERLTRRHLAALGRRSSA